MSDVFRDGRFQAQDWPVLAADAPLPAAGGVVIGKARYLAERDALAASNAVVGLLVEPADTLDDIAADLDRFPVIVVRFPKFNDGRGFSHARILRERHGYAGELRATGDVLIDLVPFMQRSGFTAFEVVNEPTRQALTEGRLPLVPFFYQPAADAAAKPLAGRPWLRQALRAAAE